MKILRGKSLMGCIYAVMLALPLFSIAGRVLYTQSNHNAKDSYSGQETIQYENINNVDDLQIGRTYHFNGKLGLYDNSSQANTNRIYYSNVQNLQTTNDYIGDKLTQGNNFNFYYSTTTLALYFYDNETNIGSTSITTYECSFDFILTGYTESSISNNLTFLTYKNMSNYNYIDNAFDYSLNQFVTDNDFGELNMFSWFGNLLLSNNTKNMLYIHFVNWYLNYALFVSLINILFLVIMWFVNYCRRLLERGMNYDW